MRFVIPIMIGILLIPLFFVLAAFGGGACHCSTPLIVFFPYVSMFGVHADWGVLSFLLIGLQFPLYGIAFTMAKGPNWKARMLVILLAVHAAAAFVAFQFN